MYRILLITLLVSGCFESIPPKGFEAVVPPEENSTRIDCPNLVDTYLLSSDQEQNQLLSKPIDGKDSSYFAIDSLVADQAYNYSLRMSRDYFIRYSQQLKNSDPVNYYYWRENTLSMKNNYSEEHLANILKYGSAFERRGQFHIYGCSKGWAKIQEIAIQQQDIKTNEIYVKQDDVWLARDKYGDLLIHTISYRQKSGWTFWAAGGAGMTLIPINDQWNKIRKAPDANLSSIWSDVDLPAVVRPVRNNNKCPISSNEIVDFNQRLLQNGMIIEKFSVQPNEIKEGTCVQSSLLVGFSSITRTQGEEIMQQLVKDPLVEHIDLLETSIDAEGKSHYTLQLGLHDTRNLH